MPFTRSRILQLCTLAAASAAGCAAHPSGSSVNNLAPQAVQLPVDPRASLTLDQIQPVPQLAAPATQPGDQAPLDALQWYAKSRLAEDNNNREEAIGYLQRAASIDPASFDVQSELARLYLTIDSGGDQAADALEKAAALKPDDLETQTDLGRVYLARGDLDKAVEHLRLALQTTEYRDDDDDSAVTDYYLAQSLQKQGYDRAALDEYSRLLQRLQHSPESVRGNPDLDYWLSRPDLLYAEVGRLHEKQGEPEAALAAYEFVVEHRPDDWDTRQHIVHLLLAVGRRDDAIHTAVDAVIGTHGSAQSLAMLHDASQGDEQSAVAAMRQQYRQHPEDRQVLFVLTDLLVQTGRPAEAQRTLYNALSTTGPAHHNATDTQILRKLFSSLVDAGKNDEAARLLVETSARDPDVVDSLLPMWLDLTRMTRRGHYRVEQLQKLRVDDAEQASKSYWIARLALNRPQLMERALHDAMSRDPIFAPAFRFELSRISSNDSLPPDQRQQQVDDLVSLARKRGNDALAQELLGTALLATANEAKTSGDSATEDRLGDAARGAFAAAEKQGDHSASLRFESAQAQLLAGDDPAYERAMWKLVSDRPDDEEAYNNLFRYYESRNQSERAVAVSQNWLLADPTSPAARLLRVLLLSRAGVTDEAEKMLGELYNERPDDQDVLEMMRAVLSQDHGSDDQLISILENRLAAHADDVAAVDQLLTDYIQQKRTADALRIIDAARTAVKDDGDLLYYTAHLYDRVGERDSQRDRSIQTLEMVLKVDPDNAGASNDLGYTLADEGKNLAEAEMLIRRAVELESDNTAYLDSLGWVLYKRGLFAEARGYLEKAIVPENQADPVVLNHLGDDLYRLSATADAQRRWQTAADKVDKELKQIGGDEASDPDLTALQAELKEKLKELGQGGPVNVAPVVDSSLKQASR
jgi:tetratricopeptide (TPR) repeat protein